MDVSLLLAAGLLSPQKAMSSVTDEQSALHTPELRCPGDKNRYGKPAHPGQTLIPRRRAVHHARGELPAAKIGAKRWLPRRPDRRLPHLALEPPAEEPPARVPEPTHYAP